MKKIRVDIYVPGSGEQAHEFEWCPIQDRMDTPKKPRYEGEDASQMLKDFEKRLADIGKPQCPLNGHLCLFGLTTVEPPVGCPMKVGPVEMRFSIVPGGK